MQCGEDGVDGPAEQDDAVGGPREELAITGQLYSGPRLELEFADGGAPLANDGPGGSVGDEEADGGGGVACVVWRKRGYKVVSGVVLKS